MDVNIAIANLEKSCPRMVLVFAEEWQTLKSSALAQLSHNTGSPKFPTVEETVESIHGNTVAWNDAVGKYPLWVAMIRLCHEFIGRKLQASA